MRWRPPTPRDPAPYSASSRHFLNVLYIAVPSVPEFRDCAAAHERLAEPSVGAAPAASCAPRMGRLSRRGGPQIRNSRAAVPRFSATGIWPLGQRPRAGVSAPSSPPAAICCRLHARFDALDRYFRATLGAASGWMSWPAGIPRRERQGGARDSRPRIPGSRVLCVPAMAGA